MLVLDGESRLQRRCPAQAPQIVPRTLSLILEVIVIYCRHYRARKRKLSVLTTKPEARRNNFFAV